MTDDKRAKKQANKERAQQQRKAALKKANRAELLRRLRVALLLGLSVMAFLLLTNLRNNPDALPSAYDRFRERPTACDAEQPPPEQLLVFEEVPDQALEATNPTATIATSCGDIVIMIDPAAAPQSSDAFVYLARQGFYQGTVVSEVTPGLSLTAGEPDPNGSLRTFRTGIPNEYPSDSFVFEEGTVALAGDAANRSGALLFVLEDNAPLSPRLNVFGEVVAGREVLDRIVALDRLAQPGSASRTIPAETVYIESVTIDE